MHTAMSPLIHASLHDIFEMTDRCKDADEKPCSPKLCSLIQFAVKIRGVLDEARFETAAQRAAEVLPILGCRYSSEENGWIPLENPQYLEPVSAPIETWYTRSFSSKNHQPMRVLFSREENILLFSMDHGAADAHGFSGAIFLILTLYRCLKKRPGLHIRPAAMPEDRSYDRILSAYSDDELRRLIEAELQAADAMAEARQVFAGEPSSGKEKLFLENVSAEGFRQVLSYAKKHGVTVNEILMAADCTALLEFAEQHGQRLSVVPLRIAIDLRRHLPAVSRGSQKLMTAGLFLAPEKWLPTFLASANVMMNWSVPIWLPVAITGGHDFTSVLVDVVRTSRALKASACGIGVAAWIERSFAGIPDAFTESGFFDAPFISNAGVIQKEWLNFGRGIEVEEVMPFGYFNGGYQFSLDAVTWNGQLALSTVADAESEICPAILKRVAGILEKI
ncbi:MAG: hypothetical protein Q4Q04_04755 [Methanocorpusculum sp.]|nr:hypothetical protein [Methanocorpusculum sp.]